MFFELKPEEKIIKTLRRHWLVLTLSLVWFLPVLLAPFILWFIVSFFNIQNIFFAPFFWLLSSLWWLFAWAGLAINWVNIYLDYWIITNQRIISTYQKGLFRREVSELSFSRIQDITVNVRGILKTFINYGNLEIRTAGTFETGKQEPDSVKIFIFKDIPKPYEVQNILSKIHYDFVNSIIH